MALPSMLQGKEKFVEEFTGEDEEEERQEGNLGCRCSSC
jgi:hypothetical protein